MSNGIPQGGFPQADYLTADALLTAAGLPDLESRHAALVALHDAAPAQLPTTADVAGPRDRHFLSALIHAHEQAMNAARHRANYEQENALRVSGENVRLRADVRSLKGEVEWLRHQLAELGGDRPREGR